MEAGDLAVLSVLVRLLREAAGNVRHRAHAATPTSPEPACPEGSALPDRLQPGSTETLPNCAAPAARLVA